MKRWILLAIPALLFAVSGCVFDSNDDKPDVKKGSISGEVKMTVTGEPLSGIKVYLVNTSAAIDTVDFTKNRKALVDSAVTGADGKFSLTGVAPGNYGVVPMNAAGDTANVYRFAPDQNSGPYQFSLNGESRTVNFIAEKLNSAGADGDNYFEITLYVKNAPYLYHDAIILRRNWTLFIPIYDQPYVCEATDEANDVHRIRIVASYGYTALFYTLDNYFAVRLDNGLRDVFLGFTNAFTPDESTFEYDYATQELKQIG